MSDLIPRAWDGNYIALLRSAHILLSLDLSYLEPKYQPSSFETEQAGALDVTVVGSRINYGQLNTVLCRV